MTEPADLEVRPARPGFFRRLSVVWLVPVIALAVSMGLAWQAYSDRGELIEILFKDAGGITPGETVIKYREVTIGTVEKVGFSQDLASVVVSARVDKSIAPFLDEDAQFWIVKPEVSLRGISGLNTVLSGVFIEGTWNSTIGTSRVRFAGLEEAPQVPPGQEGKVVTFRTSNANQISAGAPVLYKGIEVGVVERPRLSENGDAVLFDAFIGAPYDQKLTTATRFWDTSGFSVTLGTSGLVLNVNSIASLLEGGVSFDTLVSGGEPIENGHVFVVFEDETIARQSVFEDPSAEELPFSVLFDGSVNGLAVGSEVMFRGVKVGQVTDLTAVLRDTPDGETVKLLTNITVRPGRLGLAKGEAASEGLALMEGYVANGLRARLATASMFSSALVIELVELPDAPPAEINTAGDPYPILPSVQAELTDFTATAEGVFQRINTLPIEDLLASAINLMDSVTTLVNDPDLKKTPEAALAVLNGARDIVTSEDITRIPADLRAISSDLRGMVDQLTQGQAVANLLSAIDKADTALASIQTASADLPEITAQLKDLGAKANSLAVEDLVTTTTRLLNSADALIGTEDARALPPALTSALDEITVFLGQIREGGAIENANAAISAAESAANAVSEAANTLPALTDRLNSLVSQASGVVGSYGEQSRFNGDLLATLRDVQKAAEAITSLARTIQRNPNSLILGR